MHTFNNNLNDEEVITSHLMCVMKQFSYDKNMFERKKFVTEMLIFKNSRSQIFFKIGVLKNFAIFTGKH